MFETPILFIIFNRPETTERVFKSIREVKPKYLFIAADGPRSNNSNDLLNCGITRKIVTDNIDWDCEVKYLFRNENLGCGIGPSSAISWFFEQVEQGIILEDDCLPDPTFFSFTEELLNKYKHDEKIMHIAGSNFQNGRKRGKHSYFFSRYAPAWGWATWRRAWKKYDFKLSGITEARLRPFFEKTGFNKKEKTYWLKSFHEIADGKRKDIWDLQWAFTIWLYEGIAITPQNNLISNIGFGRDATHTIQTESKVANLQTDPIFEIIHPDKIEVNYAADKFTFANHVEPSSSWFHYIRHQIIPVIIPLFLKTLLRGKREDPKISIQP